MSHSVSFAQLQTDKNIQNWAKSQIQTHGFLIVTDFWDASDITHATNEITTLINNYQPTNLHVFSTITPAQHKEKYFMNSARDISFFLEADAIDKDANLVYPKELAINKIGHALHTLNPIFKALTFSQKTRFLTQEILEMEKVAIPQSMVICKPPHIGGAVKPHQDSTYMSTTPDTLTGFWIPLEKATQENCCLWAIPGSHDGPLLQKLEWDEATQACQYTYPSAKGDITAEYIPLEMQAGSVLVFKGKLLHASKHNSSGKSRLAYSFHLYDAAKSIYDSKNWLPEMDGFPGF